jgi:hypothetical protein|tara:strand:+ start:334 stop:708 length:375 start_codon:yes stop_codon:yes gene_type:complete
MSEIIDSVSTEVEDLKPKKLTNKAPQGMTTFTVCRQSDETGISGEGVVIEGCVFETGHTVIHWLTPSPRGSIAFFDNFDDFIKIHVSSHPTNGTIITYDDGQQTIYTATGEVKKNETTEESRSA